MEIEHKNQNNNNFEDVMDLFEIDYVYGNEPIKRTFNQPNKKDKQSLLENLKSKILNISFPLHIGKFHVDLICKSSLKDFID